MTKEEYLHATSYSSVDEAQKDLATIQVLFPASIGVILLLDFIFQLAITVHPILGNIVLLGVLVFGIYFIWKCREIIQKTKNVTKATLLFSIVLAPLSWIWFYPQLSEPLEIIVGKRMPPTTNAVEEAEMRVKASKVGTRRALRTILIVMAIVFLIAIIANIR